MLDLQAQITALDGDVAFSAVDQSFETRTAFAAASITGAGTTINIVSVGGYAAPGDGGFSRWEYASVQSAGNGKMQSSDGAWWQYAPEPWGINAAAFGVLATGAAVTTELQEVVDFAAGLKIVLPDGTILTDTITAARGWIVGNYETEIRLSSTGTNTILAIDNLQVADFTYSDNGRSGLDHTTTPAVYLATSVNEFQADRVHFKTDRAVAVLTGSGDGSICRVWDCTFERVNAPIASEEDTTNIFASTSGIRRVDFRRNNFAGLMGRQAIGFEFKQTSAGNNETATAVIEDNEFDLFQTNGSGNEVKVVFVQGYNARVELNTFRDCFGRHIDVLGNNDTALARLVTQKSMVKGNRHVWSTENTGAVGAGNSQAGCVYCRYGDVIVRDNHLDFTNLTLDSPNLYVGIAVKHGYYDAEVLSNTIINPPSSAIQVDVSDSIDIAKCSATVRDNKIYGATNASFKPLRFPNTAATKQWDHLVVVDNEIEYSQSADSIELFATGRASSFACDAMTVRGNWNKTFNSWDGVSFLAFPEHLDAPNTTVTLTIDTAGTNASGTITSLSDGFGRASRYRCKELTIQPGGTATMTAGVTGLGTIAPRKLTIDGDNGASGKFSFSCASTEEVGVSLALDGNLVVFDGTKHISTGGSSTTSLFVLTGRGQCNIITPDGDDAEYFVDTRGPHVGIRGGNVSGCTTIVRTDGDGLITVAIDGVAGSGNTNLYDFQSPTHLVRVGTTGGVTGAKAGSVAGTSVV